MLSLMRMILNLSAALRLKVRGRSLHHQVHLIKKSRKKMMIRKNLKLKLKQPQSSPLQNKHPKRHHKNRLPPEGEDPQQEREKTKILKSLMLMNPLLLLKEPLLKNQEVADPLLNLLAERADQLPNKPNLKKKMSTCKTRRLITLRRF